MASNKAADLIDELATYYQAISTANGYFNTVVADGVTFGEESYNETGKGNEYYPRVKIIANQIDVPEFSTKSCSRTHIELTVHGYLRKGKSRETGPASYRETLEWRKDLADAFRAYLNGQDGGAVDADLFDSDFNQQIGFSKTHVTVSSTFTLSFDEKLGVN